MATSSTVSGSSVSASITFTNLVDRCQVSLNDEGAATWDTEMIANWLNDAIRDYSQHFPRLKTQSIACSAGDSTYDLNDDFQGVVSVEYPTGQDPKAYLSRIGYTHPDYLISDSYYDIVPRWDDTDESELWLSASPSAGESISVLYNAHHVLMSDPSSPSGESSIVPQHQHLLVKYVLWQASTHLMMAEQQSPTSNSSLLMAQLSSNARRLENSYHTALRQALYAADGQSRPVPWLKAGGMQRIY